MSAGVRLTAVNARARVRDNDDDNNNGLGAVPTDGYSVRAT